MRYDDNIVEEVRSRNNIVDVIGGYVKLQKKGANHMGLCPFHGEKTPSFSVSASKQMYYCFGCGKGGNVFTFLQEYESLTFVEALRELAGRVGVELPEEAYNEEAKRAADEKNRLYEVNKVAAQYFHYLLNSPNGKRAKEYFLNRGLTEETIKHFGLGYSDKFSNDLYQYLKKKGYSDELLKQSGLVSLDERRGGSDKFWNRAMFPIMDVNNKVIAFGGRVMGEGEPKYLNSPETKIFDKSRNLYGLNYAKKSRKNYMLLCEGYMDVIALHQAGFTNAVASLGTAFTGLHAKLLSRYTTEVIITYDSDGAGTKAALRAIPILQDAGITVKVLDMKPYKDPDEFIRALGTDEYQRRIEEAKGSFFFEIATMEKNYDMKDPEQKTRFYREIATRLTAFSEEIERNNYMEAVDAIYHIGLENLRKLVNRTGAKLVNTQVAEITAEREKEQSRIRKASDTAVVQAQKMLLTWAAEDLNLLQSIRSYLSLEHFCDEPYHTVAKMMYEQYETEGIVTPARIIGHYDSTEEQAVVAGLFSAALREDMTDAERERTFSDTVKRIMKNFLDVKGKEAIEQNDIATYQKIVKETMNLQKLHISLNGRQQ